MWWPPLILRGLSSWELSLWLRYAFSFFKLISRSCSTFLPYTLLIVLFQSNAYFQGAVRQAESWKRASDKADNALRRQQKKYATLEKKLKRKEEELGESNAELVVLRADKDKAIDNYLDSEEFAQSMRIRDDSVFPGFFSTGWDTALGTVNEACPDINPADYICPDDEALLQRFRTLGPCSSGSTPSSSRVFFQTCRG